jgi:uncharacterized protein YceK
MMKKLFSIIIVALALSGCADVMKRQQPVCTASAVIGGQSALVQIYDVKKINGQTKYKAGYPFNWKWVSKNNFTDSTCN